MVVIFLFNAFTHDELLARRLADEVVSAHLFEGLSAPCPATVVAFACALAGGSVNPLRGAASAFPTESDLLVMS